MNASEIALAETLRRWEAVVRRRRGRLWWRELENHEDDMRPIFRGASRRPHSRRPVAEASR
jgi:hypothetical protein